MPSRSSRPILSEPVGVEHALSWEPEILHNPKALLLRAGRALLVAIGGAAASLVLDAGWWVVALVAVAATVAVVAVELLRIRHTVRKPVPADTESRRL